MTDSLVKLRDMLSVSRKEIAGLLRLICTQIITIRFFLSETALVIQFRPLDKCFCGLRDASHGLPGTRATHCEECKKSGMIETMNCLIKHLSSELDACWFEGCIIMFVVKDWRTKIRWDTMHSNVNYSEDDDECLICWSSTPWVRVIDTPDPVIKVLTDSEDKWIGVKVCNATIVLYTT